MSYMDPAQVQLFGYPRAVGVYHLPYQQLIAYGKNVCAHRHEITKILFSGEIM
jgi:hypothetical protein